jgi:peptidyl-prolyl cis-trans isomerase SurA
MRAPAGVRLGALGVAALLVGGCALSVPTWVPWLGRKGSPPPPPTVAAPAPEPPSGGATPAAARSRPADDDAVTDRIVAVVNNDAITLAELQESIVAYRAENRQRSGPTDEELQRDFLNKLIESRLQLQEADREKITVEDVELNEEFLERIKHYGVTTEAEFEKLLRGQGVTIDSIKKRLRDGLRVNKLVRRKVSLRVSVTEEEITRYLAENRDKLETGLSYHARHILVAPEAATDIAWEAARIKAEMLRSQLQDGADFAELAKKHSRDASARDGGDLGTLKRGELAQDVEGAILALKPEDLSPPFKSSLGYHLFRLESRESLDGEGMTRIRQQIRDILFRQKYETRLEAWLREIRERAIIEVRM